jgi:hypothetical protein
MESSKEMTLEEVIKKLDKKDRKPWYLLNKYRELKGLEQVKKPK